MLIKTLNQKRAGQDLERLRLLHALYEGGPALHALKDQLFPQSLPAEKPDLWAERKQKVRYTNYVAGIVDLITSTVTKSPATVEGFADPAVVERLTHDADKLGTPLSSLTRRLLSDMLWSRRAWVWVDRPAVDPAAPVPVSRADQEASGALEVYLRPIDPICVLNWGMSGNALAWVVLHDRYVRQDSPTDVAVEVHRWRVVTAEKITTYEWTPVEGKTAPSDADEALLADERPGPGYMPIAFGELPMSLWLLHRLEDPALAMLAAENDLAWSLWRTSNAILVLTRKLNPGDTPIGGSGYYFDLTRDKDGADAAEFIEPGGSANAALAAHAAEREKVLHRVVGQTALAADAGGSNQSGESKRMDWDASERMMVAYSEATRGLLRQVFAIVATAIGDTAAIVEVEGLDEHSTDDVAAFLQNVALAVELKRSPYAVAKIAGVQFRALFGDQCSDDDVQTVVDEVAAAMRYEGPSLTTDDPEPEGPDDEPAAGS